MDFNMRLKKLMSDFHITSNLVLGVKDLVSGFPELQLQLKISKVTIIHALYLKVVSATFLLVCLLSLNKSSCQFRKNAFY